MRHLDLSWAKDKYTPPTYKTISNLFQLFLQRILIYQLMRWFIKADVDTCVCKPLLLSFFPFSMLLLRTCCTTPHPTLSIHTINPHTAVATGLQIKKIAWNIISSRSLGRNRNQVMVDNTKQVVYVMLFMLTRWSISQFVKFTCSLGDVIDLNGAH